MLYILNHFFNNVVMDTFFFNFRQMFKSIAKLCNLQLSVLYFIAVITNYIIFVHSFNVSSKLNFKIPSHFIKTILVISLKALLFKLRFTHLFSYFLHKLHENVCSDRVQTVSNRKYQDVCFPDAGMRSLVDLIPSVPNVTGTNCIFFKN